MAGEGSYGQDLCKFLFLRGKIDFRAAISETPVEQSLPFFLMVMPFVYVVTLLPISLGGLGGREGTLAFFLVRVGVATSDAVMLGFVIYVSRIAVSLLGSLWHYVSSHERRQDKFRQLGQE
jgi:glycosyltransferase 2 family protein